MTVQLQGAILQQLDVANKTSLTARNKSR